MDLNFLFAYFFVIVALFYSYYQKFGLEKEIAISSIRGFIQLFILAFILVYIFEFENSFFIILSIFIMIIFASFTAKSRIKLPKHSFLIPCVSIATPTIVVVGSLLIVGALDFRANIVIPIAGMIIGNALNVYTLSIDRLKSDIAKSIPQIEGMLSLGVPLKESTNTEVKNAIKASLHPIINNLQTLGIVFIPGMMSGMIIAGANPLYALSFQMIVMYMLLSVSLICAIIATRLSYKFLIYH